MPGPPDTVAEQGATTVLYGPLRIAHDPRVLAPRDWTRGQSVWAAELMSELPEGRILDLCTGAGHIGLLAALLSGREAVLVDVDATACHYARLNATDAGLEESVQVRQALAQDALTPGESFPCILVDPPWVPSAEVHRFPEDPPLAIDGGEDGLDVVRALLDVVAEALDPAGIALVQLGSVEQTRGLEQWLDTGHAPALRITEVRAYGDRGVVALLRHR